MTQPPGNYPPPPAAQPAGPQPKTHLAFAILTTIFCCLPFGIVSIVKASQVSGLWAQGRYPEAQAASDSAAKWAKISLAIGLFVILINVILALTGVTDFDFDTETY
ncbi:CD225/dispanin family protein [Mycobacterium sp. WMMD1722]|uniref:CD225/dispanin family protein n=1 Tax=Mycobacterium sp. WMMD1722 TaxID=3404117 RepID=UPI003BF612B2